MPLTDAQRNALPTVRARISSTPFSFGTAESVEQRARLPAPPEILPSDVTVRVEIIPPSPNPDPILESTGVLKAPERVPIYFYALRNEGAEAIGTPDPIPVEIAGNTSVIFFIHGGGNVTGHPTLAPFLQYYVALLRAVASHSSGAAKCVLVAPSYRLATVPENAFPAGLQDILAAYDYVLGKGYKPSNIVIAGDSAGGNHAVVLTHLLLQAGKDAPRGVVAIAPSSIVDRDLFSDHAKSLADHDILDPSIGRKMTDAYVGGTGVPPSDPLVSGAFLPFSESWPKTLIMVGTWDALIDSAYELKKRLTALKRPIELVEYDERPHGWWSFPQLFSEDIQDSAKRIARFVLDPQDAK